MTYGGCKGSRLLEKLSRNHNSQRAAGPRRRKSIRSFLIGSSLGEGQTVVWATWGTCLPKDPELDFFFLIEEYLYNN